VKAGVLFEEEVIQKIVCQRIQFLSHSYYASATCFSAFTIIRECTIWAC